MDKIDIFTNVDIFNGFVFGFISASLLFIVLIFAIIDKRVRGGP